MSKAGPTTENGAADDDLTLVRRFRLGDHAAFERLVRRWDARILDLAHRMLSDVEDASDVRQSVFVRAFQSLDRFDGRAQFSTWLYRIAVNLCRDHLRSRLASRKRHERITENRLMTNATECTADAATDAQGLGRLVARAVEALSDKHREAIVLRHYSGLTFPQIAAILSVPETTVKSRVLQALELLRDRLEPHVGDGAPTRSTGS